MEIKGNNNIVTPDTGSKTDHQIDVVQRNTIRCLMRVSIDRSGLHTRRTGLVSLILNTVRTLRHNYQRQVWNKKDHGGHSSEDVGRRPCSDSTLYKQAGNTVSVPVVTLIATELLKILSEKGKRIPNILDF